MRIQPIRWHEIEMVLPPAIPYDLTANGRAPFQLHCTNAKDYSVMDHNAHKNILAMIAVFRATDPADVAFCQWKSAWRK